MAERDIPPYVKFSPGGLIRSDDHNTVQRRARNSVRTHRHTRVVGQPADDGRTDDSAVQIATDEIADGAVTAAKLAPGALSGDAIPDGAISTAKIEAGAITGDTIRDNNIIISKLRRLSGSLDTDVELNGNQTKIINLGNPDAFWLVSVASRGGFSQVDWHMTLALVGLSGVIAQVVLNNRTGIAVTVRIRALPLAITE